MSLVCHPVTVFKVAWCCGEMAEPILPGDVRVCLCIGKSVNALKEKSLQGQTGSPPIPGRLKRLIDTWNDVVFNTISGNPTGNMFLIRDRTSTNMQ